MSDVIENISLTFCCYGNGYFTDYFQCQRFTVKVSSRKNLNVVDMYTIPI